MNQWDDQDWATTEAMIRMGGSFVQLLGQLYRAADGSNRANLRATFPHYFAEYCELAKRIAKAEKQ